MHTTVNTAVNKALQSSLTGSSKQPSSPFSSSISDMAGQFQEDAANHVLANGVQQRAQEDPSAFRQALDLAFGDKSTPNQLDALTSMASGGNLPLPQNVRFVDAGSLGPAAMGAYDSSNGGSIFLDKRLLNDSAALEAVYTEKLGHHLDAGLGGADAAGDEGAIFSQSLLQGRINSSELQVLKSENDNGFIEIDGERLAVEFFGYSGPGSSPGTGGSSSSSSSSNSSQALGAASSESFYTPASTYVDTSSLAGVASVSGANTDDNELSVLVAGRASAAGRESLVTTQINRAYGIGANTPQTNYDGTIYRVVPGARFTTYADFTYSDQGGRVGAPGQTVLYNSENLDGVHAEAAHYTGTENPTGMSNKAVVKSDFNGSIVDVVGLNRITASALSEPFGGEHPAKKTKDADGKDVNGPLGKDRTLGSKITGEDPYAIPRAFANGARAQGAEAIRVPANESFVNLNIIPDNTRSMADQYQYVNHTNYDANGNATDIVVSSSVAPPPDGTKPGINISNNSKFPDILADDTKLHSRANGARYGAVGAGFMSATTAVSDGHISLEETGVIVANSTTGAAVAVGSDALGNKIGIVKGGAVFDGAVAVGTSVWSNADAVENGEMSAGDATADVVVDTGVAVAAGVTGMAAGAAVGSVIPIAGTVVGAGVGFAVGMGGAWLASKSLEDFTGAGDFAREKLGNVLENRFEKPLNSAWNGVADAKDATVDFVSDGYNETKNTVSNAGSAVKRFVSGLFGR